MGSRRGKKWGRAARQGVVIGGTAVLAGCSIFQPEAPESPGSVVTGVPPAWTATMDPVAAAAAPVEPAQPFGENWLEQFGDAQLRALVEEAWSNNAQLLSAIAKRDAAAARTALEKAARLPRLDFQAAAGRQRQINDFLGDSTLVPEDAYISRLRLGLGLSWELDFWGRALNLTNSAMNELGSALLDVEAAKFSLAGQVASLWFGLVAADQRLQVSQQLQDSQIETVRFSRERHASGLMTTVELLRLEADLAGAQADVVARQLERDRAARQLEVLLGRYPANALEAAQNLPAVPAPITVGVPSELLERRPDMQAAALRVAASDQRLLAAKKNLLPRFSISASGSTQSKYRDLLFYDDSFVWSIGGGILQPLFDGGQIRAGIRAQRALMFQSIHDYRQKAYTAFREVEDALAAEISLRKQLEFLDRSVQLAEQNEALARDNYENGLLDAGTSMATQRGVLLARLRALDLNLALLNNRLALNLALGGSPIVEEQKPAAQPGGPVEESAPPAAEPVAPPAAAEAPPEPPDGVAAAAAEPALAAAEEPPVADAAVADIAQMPETPVAAAAPIVAAPAPAVAEEASPAAAAADAAPMAEAVPAAVEPPQPPAEVVAAAEAPAEVVEAMTPTLAEAPAAQSPAQPAAVAGPVAATVESLPLAAGAVVATAAAALPADAGAPVQESETAVPIAAAAAVSEAASDGSTPEVAVPDAAAASAAPVPAVAEVTTPTAVAVAMVATPAPAAVAIAERAGLESESEGVVLVWGLSEAVSETALYTNAEPARVAIEVGNARMPRNGLAPLTGGTVTGVSYYAVGDAGLRIVVELSQLTAASLEVRDRSLRLHLAAPPPPPPEEGTGPEAGIAGAP